MFSRNKEELVKPKLNFCKLSAAVIVCSLSLNAHAGNPSDALFEKASKATYSIAKSGFETYSWGSFKRFSFRDLMCFFSPSSCNNNGGSNPEPTPTPTPTAKPTTVPTPVPTPTPIPTKEPIPEPSEVPTPEPTQEPIPEPSDIPTSIPTPPVTGGPNEYGVKVIGGCELTEEQTELWNAHNEARSQARTCGGNYYEAANAVNWHCKLADASDNHSMDMATQNYFSHTSLDGSSPWDRAAEAGYDAYASGENIAAGYATVEHAMAGWLKSSGHCSNIMRASHTEMGAAVVRSNGSQYGSYWTMNMGRR